MMTDKEKMEFEAIVQGLGKTKSDIEIAKKEVGDILDNADKEVQAFMGLMQLAKHAWYYLDHKTEGQISPQETFEVILGSLQRLGVDVNSKKMQKKMKLALKNCEIIDNIAHVATGECDDECDCGGS